MARPALARGGRSPQVVKLASALASRTSLGATSGTVGIRLERYELPVNPAGTPRDLLITRYPCIAHVRRSTTHGDAEGAGHARSARRCRWRARPLVAARPAGTGPAGSEPARGPRRRRRAIGRPDVVDVRRTGDRAYDAGRGLGDQSSHSGSATPGHLADTNAGLTRRAYALQNIRFNALPYGSCSNRVRPGVAAPPRLSVPRTGASRPGRFAGLRRALTRSARRPREAPFDLGTRIATADDLSSHLGLLERLSWRCVTSWLGSRGVFGSFRHVCSAHK